MKELIFNIADVFNDKTASGCLSQYDAICYHIPAYQRGYKWGSEKNGAVNILLNDLWSSFEQQESEYYLQYITVKRQPLLFNSKTEHCLEVIDGQQRLTTLSILLAALLEYTEEDYAPEDNVALCKLDYAIRENFFDDFIYDGEEFLKFVAMDWEELVESDPERLDRQDVFYLHGAAKACSKFVEDVKKKEVAEFLEYIHTNVKLIVNSIEPHIKSETVFKNLNSNKVPLTEVELIKGLLLTHVGRQHVQYDDSRFREVIEVRLSLGKSWEGIQQWAYRPEIENFYFEGKGSGLNALLRLTAMILGARASVYSAVSTGTDLPLFNFYNNYQDKKAAFKALVMTQKRLDDWFETDEIYHLIGYCRFAKKSEYKKLSFLSDCLAMQTRDELVEWLNDKKMELIYGAKSKASSNEESIKSLQYGEDDKRIHAVLLALSVFPQEKSRRRFDFEAFKAQDWSLEHIFPQAPEGKGQILNDKQKENIRKMLGEVSQEVEAVLCLPMRDSEQRAIYENALNAIGVLDNIGNMCLLTRRDNSALGNQFFDGKRNKVLTLIQKGSFVPKHTFDVFAKMILDLNDDIEQWSADDIALHAKYISSIFEIGDKEPVS